jgi:hypothetical protein
MRKGLYGPVVLEQVSWPFIPYITMGAHSQTNLLTCSNWKLRGGKEEMRFLIFLSWAYPNDLTSSTRSHLLKFPSISNNAKLRNNPCVIGRNFISKL